MPQSDWPNSSFEIQEDDRSELRSNLKSINPQTREVSGVNVLIQRFSNFNRLRRPVAYALRFVEAVSLSIGQKL